jgi:hypothetical protein
MNEPIQILSLGAGVQSSTLALMAAAGEVTPMPSSAVFSDTKAEPKSVYVWLNWLEQQLSFPVAHVTAGSLTEKSLLTKTNLKTGQKYYSNLIPAFIENPDGSRGIVGRHCTYNHKIIPILKECRRLVGKESMAVWRKKHRPALLIWSAWKRAAAKAKKEKHQPPAFPTDEWASMQADPLIVQWIGISLDEISRMKPSRDPWIFHRWPLIEREMNRHDCLRWMAARKFPEPPRSACTYCPFHSDHEWRRLRDKEPEAFAEAVKFERDLQALHCGHPINGQIKGVPFLHDSLIPLDKVDFSTDQDHGQQVMFNNECEGMCGV